MKPSQHTASWAAVLILLATTLVRAEPLRGDLNGNGKVDIGDVVIVLRIAVGLQSAGPSEIASADLTNDGRIAIDDASLLLRIAIGLLPPPSEPPLQKPGILVSISPQSALIPPKGSLQFEAKVFGTADQAVEWSVQEGQAGGYISQNGVYTAPEALGTYHVIVKSKADPAKSAAAEVQVAGLATDYPISVPKRPPKVIIIGDPSDGGKRTPMLFFTGKASVEPIAKPLIKPKALTDKSAVFTESIKELEIEPGTLIIFCEGSGALKRAASAKSVDGQTEVDLEPASLTELLEAADFSFTKPITPSDVESFKPLVPGVGPLQWTEQIPSEPQKFEGGQFTIPIDLWNLPNLPNLKITGNLSWKAALDVGAYWDWWNWNHRGFWCIGEFNIQFNGTATCTAPTTAVEVSVPLFEMPLAVFWIQVGPVPVLFKPDFSVELSVSIDLNGSVSVQPVASLSGRFGSRYDNDAGGFKVVNDVSRSISLSPTNPIESFLSGNVRVGVGPDLDLLVYGVIGAYISLEVPYFNANFTSQSNPPQVSLNGKIGISGDAGLRLSVLNWGIDFSIAGFDIGSDVFNYTYPIYPTISSLSFNPSEVAGGATSQGTVTLSWGAPQGGAVINLNSSNPAVIPPSAVTVPTGQTQTSFTVNTQPVANDVQATVTASYRNSSKSAVLTVRRRIQLANVSLQPTSVIGGSSATGTVSLNGPAPAGGVAVTLTSSNTNAAVVPISVLVPPGKSSAEFTVTTKLVNLPTNVVITASYDGVTKTAALTVSPPSLSSITINPSEVVGGSSATGTVSLNGPAPLTGAVVALTSSNTNAASVPQQVTISAGQTQASFTITTKTVTKDVAVKITAFYGDVPVYGYILVRSEPGVHPTSLGEIQCGVQWLSHGDWVKFPRAFSTVPTIVVSAQRGGFALAAAAVDNSAAGFRLAVYDINGAPITTGAWVQWLAIVPAPNAPVRTEVAQRRNGDYVAFNPPLPGYPVIICSAQRGGVPLLACAVNNSAGGFLLALRDLNGNPVVDGAWVQTVALVIPSDKDAYQGLELQAAVQRADSAQTISFGQLFEEIPTILTSAQKYGIALAACAVDNARNGFWLAMSDYDGLPVSQAWLQWLAIRPK
ncbi:MAG: dockerin type I domain-containing protein [Armatimonadota bacterium]